MNKPHSAIGQGRRRMIRDHIRQAEEAAREALYAGTLTEPQVYESIASAREMTDALLFPAGGCAGPDCTLPVPEKRRGRPALYCSRRCKDKSSYLRKRQRGQQAGA